MKINIEELVAYIKSFLPDYMVPKMLTELPSFPMTVNGKIDRQALHDNEDTITFTQRIRPLYTEFEQKIAEIWSSILNVPIKLIGSSSNFFELGGNSLLVVKMLTQASNKLAMEFKLNRFMAIPTIANLSMQADSIYDPTETLKEFCKRLTKDIILEEQIQPLKEPNPDLEKPKTILLTGATGFLGAHLLYELLEKTEAQIYCLVRASSNEEALQKINAKQEKYKLSSAKSLGRIIPVLGDLEKSKLGLTIDSYDVLAQKIDSIMHVGAWVHHVFDYKTLYQSNVQSLREALKLAVDVKNKKLHFVSTLATNLISPIERLQTLSPDSLDTQLNTNGYLTTKWVAEQLLKVAKARGIAVCIYRPGNIIAGSNSIYEPKDNHTLLRLKGLLQLGKGFIDPLEKVEMMPVDLLSQAIINLCSNPKLPSYNLNNSETITWVEYLQIAKNLGFPFVHLEEREEWNKILINLDESNALYKLSHFYNSANDFVKSEQKPIVPDYKIDTPDYKLMVEQAINLLNCHRFFNAAAIFTFKDRKCSARVHNLHLIKNHSSH